MLRVNQLTGFGAGGSSPDLSYTVTSTNVNTTNLTTYTFTSQSIGSAPASGERRFIFVACGAIDEGNSSNVDIVSALIGGVAADAIYEGNSFNWIDAAIFYREVSSGTTADISVTWDVGCEGMAITVYRVISGPEGIEIGTVQTSTAQSPSRTMTTGPGGVLIATWFTRYGLYSLGSHTWTNLTEDYEVDANSEDVFSSASALTTTSSVTVSASTSSADNRSFVCVPILKK